MLIVNMKCKWCAHVGDVFSSRGRHCLRTVYLGRQLVLGPRTKCPGGHPILGGQLIL